MKSISRFDIRFEWQDDVLEEGTERFFLGGWHPDLAINVELAGFSDKSAPCYVSGDNWFLICSKSDCHPEGAGPVHAIIDGSGKYQAAICLSGYLLDLGIHSYSASENVFRILKNSNKFNYNGIFSLINIYEYGRKIELRTDAFGFSPFYYRLINGMILFSSSARFLRLVNDVPDYMAWRCLIQSRHVNSDRTLSKGIKRFPAGGVIFNDGFDIKVSRWFDYSAVPSGKKDIDKRGISELEESFRAAMSKCLKLEIGRHFLPLSSGYDSRRILAVLNDLKVDFESATVRVFQKGYRDLDAKFSSLMAQEFGFRHRVVNLPSGREYGHHDWQRRVILDAESSLHTWYLSLLKELPSGPAVVFDGIGGDILGETGFELADFYQGSHLEKINKITKYFIDDSFDGVFNKGMFPSSCDVRMDLCKYLSDIPGSISCPDISFLLSRTRRAISICSQQILPKKCTVVFPYLDLDYVFKALSFNPLDKINKSIQARCLETYWPKYFSYGGNHSYEQSIPMDGANIYRQQLTWRFARLKYEIISQGGMSDLLYVLSNRSKIVLLSLCLSQKSLWSRGWYLLGAMELVARQSRQSYYLNVKCV